MGAISEQARSALERLLEAAGRPQGALLVLGGSTSAIAGEQIGKASNLNAAFAVLEGILPLAARHGLKLAVQGCEHLNRALAVPAQLVEEYDLTEVLAVPVPHAGGSLAAAYYSLLDEPLMVADLRTKARLGLDLGGVLVGMHLQPVVAPVWFGGLRVGAAHVTGGYSRPPKIGGERAVYDRRALDELLP